VKVSASRIVRQRIWEKLAAVARPDARFHMNFAEVIPDFESSEAATSRIVALPAFQESRLAFITPDNSLTGVRRRMLEAKKSFIMPTYNMLRGFLYIEPSRVPAGAEPYAAWLEGMEHFGIPVTLEQIARLGRFDFMATGASAVSTAGIRFGKGHGFFDLEWGIFTDLGLAHDGTLVAAIVHDVQVVDDRIPASQTDIVVDLIATPSRLIEIPRHDKRPRGIKWHLLPPDLLAATPPLRELARMRGVA
jgi:5-formyltetrahydrofolate cyclo-ligase